MSRQGSAVLIGLAISAGYFAPMARAQEGVLADSATRHGEVIRSVVETAEKEKQAVDQQLADSLVLLVRAIQREKVKTVCELRAVVTKDSLEEAARTEAFNRSYDVGSLILSQMVGATRTINFTEHLLQTDVMLSKVTNPWADEDLRNAWDNADHWGTVVGIATAAFGAFSGQPGDQRNTVGVGLLLAGASKAVGNLFGATAKGTFEEKASFVEFTRRAYDDVHTRNDILSTYIAQNRSKLRELEDFQSLYAQARGDTARVQRLTQLDPYLVSFAVTLEQVPSVLALYRSLVASYMVVKPDTVYVRKLRDPQLITALESIQKNLQELEAEYADVRKFLDVSPRLRVVLYDWKLPPKRTLDVSGVCGKAS